MAGEFNLEDITASLQVLDGARTKQQGVHEVAKEQRRSANQLDHEAEATTAAAWLAARDSYLSATEAGPVDSRELLESALRFASDPVPKSLKEKKRTAPRNRPRGGMYFAFLEPSTPKLDPAEALAFYDTMEEGVPIFTPYRQGALAGRPSVSIEKHWKGVRIGVSLVASMFDVDKNGVSAEQRELLVPLDPGHVAGIYVGATAIQAYANGLKAEQTPDRCGHGNLESNLAALQTVRSRVGALAQGMELALDLTTLDEQIRTAEMLERMEESRQRLRYGDSSIGDYIGRS